MNKEIKMPQCCENVYDRDIWRYHQCLRKSIIERNGKFYCKIHDPEYIKAKGKEREERYEVESCKKCQHHFSCGWHSYCPICGTKRVFGKQLKKEVK